jgi:N-acetylneuraminic acid mutarotase
MKKLRWTPLIITLIFSFFACHPDDPIALVGNWSRRSDFDGSGRYGAASFCIGQKGYLGFGYGTKNGLKAYLTDFWSYDSEVNAWTQVADCPGTGRTSCVGFSIGNDGYVGTGQDINTKYLRDFWKYSSVSNAWSKIDSLPNGYERAGGLSFAINNVGYVGTGYNGNYLKDFWKLNPATGTWTLLPGYGGAKRRDGVSFVIDGKAYICTGVENGSYVTDLWRFDPATETWAGGIDAGLRPISTVTNSNYKMIRTNAVGFSNGTKGYVALGSSGSLLNDVWEYDPTTDFWTKKTNLEGPNATTGVARYAAIAFSIPSNNRIFVGLGTNGGSNWFDDLWEFDPTAAYDPYN